MVMLGAWYPTGPSLKVLGSHCILSRGAAADGRCLLVGTRSTLANLVSYKTHLMHVLALGSIFLSGGREKEGNSVNIAQRGLLRYTYMFLFLLQLY